MSKVKIKGHLGADNTGKVGFPGMVQGGEVIENSPNKDPEKTGSKNS